MGLALVVMYPMLYTDTNEVWKLSSRREDLLITGAGMISELLLALAGIWLWLLLPEGHLKAAADILDTSMWVMALMLNASPFMRFEG